MRYKKIIITFGILFGIYAVGTYIYFSIEPLSKEDCPITIPGKAPLVLHDSNYPHHVFKITNDASCLNATRVYDMVAVKTIEDIAQALALAQENNVHVAIAGVRHSMGGQALLING